jgi:hypothetical protein
MPEGNTPSPADSRAAPKECSIELKISRKKREFLEQR